jgi:cytochrome c oxidase subunit 4
MSEHITDHIAQGDLLEIGAHEEHGGVGKYLLVFAALCFLTMCSFFTYSSYWPFKDQRQITWAFMMAVSCTKAMLVIMFFMHLLWEANWKWVLTIPASFMSIFLMLMLVPDVGMRQNNGYARYSRERWIYAADPPPVYKSDQEALDQQEKGAGGSPHYPPSQPN